MVGALDALADTGLPHGCPTDTGAVRLVIVKYDDRQSTALRIRLSGCASITNGARTVALGDATGAHLLAILDHIVEQR